MEVTGTPVAVLKRGETYNYFGGDKGVKKVKYLNPVENAWSGRKWYLFKIVGNVYKAEVLLSHGEVMRLIRQ